ncbi:hypothetical protein Ddye_008598 [Dipteronia dyeriana]|uniref:Reverse transcriptase n=1 Tax=Dipteronia dyeriana TaxID=168575 RepID=A0AAD9X9R7_9ROSI|nr:hypothetical protein Ddye_008598 [Dipteronia dyeriana]
MVFKKTVEKDCYTIKKVLDCYSRALGQLINLQKSAMCVSRGASKHSTKVLAGILGVRLVGCNERYLGLPSFMGKNKNVFFASIKNRVWDKVKGWHNKLFSIGDKEVLIKTVAPSIPTYSMSLFRLLKSLVNNLHRLYARFWRGSKEEKRKIHCCLWKKLYRSKMMMVWAFGTILFLIKQCLQNSVGG